MNKYKICLINRHLNFRRELEIVASTCIEAINIAKAQLKELGYDEVESATFIGCLG